MMQRLTFQLYRPVKGTIYAKCELVIQDQQQVEAG